MTDLIDKVIQLTRTDYKFILEDLKRVKKFLDSEITEIDVRLCIEIEDSMSSDAWTWILRSGDSSYDQRHSPICASDIVSADSKLEGVIENLINQCCDQAGDLQSNSK